MTTLNVNALEPEGGTTSMGVGLSGQNTIIGGNTIKLNTLKDAGGNTLFTSDGSGNLSSVNSAFGSAMALIQSQTADDDATISFTSNIDSTYTSYLFKFYNINISGEHVVIIGRSNIVGKPMFALLAQKFERGGLVGGRRHSAGGTMIEAERGEFVMSRSAVNAVGAETMNRINAGGGAGNINISFAGNVMSDDFISEEAIPKIKEAIRRGADIGVS